MKSLTTIEFAEKEGEVSPTPPEEGEASPPLKKGGFSLTAPTNDFSPAAWQERITRVRDTFMHL